MKRRNSHAAAQDNSDLMEPSTSAEQSLKKEYIRNGEFLFSGGTCILYKYAHT